MKKSMGIYKYHIGYRRILKKIQISLLILFGLCLIPVTTAYSQMDELIIAHEIPFEELEYIEDLEDPHASAYVSIRNSDGDLVGISHVHASRYLEHPILPLFLEGYETIETFSIANQNFEMKKVEMDLPIKEEHCLFDREFFPCYYYTFSTALGISYQIDGEYVSKYGFRGLNHAYIAEAGDTIEVVWKVLWPRN